MARRPRSEWSDSYRRRVERAEAKGLSRQAARGHKTHEHKLRAERDKRYATAFGALTSKDRAFVRAVMRRLCERGGQDPDEAIEEGMAYAKATGIERFRIEVKRQAEASRQYKKESRGGSYESHGMQLLQSWSDDGGFPEVRWYFYH